MGLRSQTWSNRLSRRRRSLAFLHSTSLSCVHGRSSGSSGFSTWHRNFKWQRSIDEGVSGTRRGSVSTEVGLKVTNFPSKVAKDDDEDGNICLHLCTLIGYRVSHPALGCRRVGVNGSGVVKMRGVGELWIMGYPMSVNSGTRGEGPIPV
jgi:hypothetical protein